MAKAKRFMAAILALSLLIGIISFTVPERSAGAASVPDYSSTFTTQTYKDTEAMRFVQGMTVGFNLGNQFDAANCSWLGSNKLAYEYAWSNAQTTEKFIQAVYDAGFNTIRIPVSWHNHVDSSYNIDEKWLARVTEVVDWAYDRGMYVIINIHHDVWNGDFYSINSASDMTKSKKYMQAIWKQLSANFKNYDEKLIFEAINEPRYLNVSGSGDSAYTTDTSETWWINEGTTSYSNAMSRINTLNQTFVDTVRAGGGNNKTRYLMVGSYDTSPTWVVKSAFKLPTDSTKDRLIVTAHMYNDYNFAQNENSTRRSFDSTAQNANIGDIKNLYNTFVKNGIPVVIGEFGCIDKNNDAERQKFFSYFVAAAKAYGMRAVVWDNNAFNTTGATSGSKASNTFGLIDRSSAVVKKTAIINSMMQYFPNQVRGVKLDKSSLTLTPSKTAKLTAAITPSNAAVKGVSFSSSNSAVVKADANGNLTALKAGSAVITVKTAQGGLTAQCKVKVNFTDVEKSSDYYYNPVYWAVDKGITYGFTDEDGYARTFGPQQNCTRAQMVTFLWRLKGKPAPTIKSSPFTDIAPGDYYYNAVLWAYEKGITKGYADDNYTTFRPDDTCLREHAVTFLYRAAGNPKISSDDARFTDIYEGDYYLKPVIWAIENGITKGYPDDNYTTFRPKNDCLREHIVTFMYRYSKL